MKSSLLAALAMFPALALASPVGGPMQDGDARFATQLYAQLGTKPGNLFFSPASVRLALAMAYAGARGATATEMRTTLGLPEGRAAHDAVAAQLARWDALAHPTSPETSSAPDPSVQKYRDEQLAQRRIQLSVVNRLWADKAAHLLPAYVALVAGEYLAPTAQLDFHHDAEAARVEINRWVSEATQHKIPELIARGLVTAATRLVLTNAIYFKAGWQDPFEAMSTKPAPFHRAGGSDVSVPFMHGVGHWKLGRFAEGQILELPYGDGALAMDVLLPTSELAALEHGLAAGKLGAWTGALADARVDVMLPKWKTTSALELAPTLQALGMKAAFTYGPADFSGIDGGHDLLISAVVHQAVVDVDEKGTEAAAATAVMMVAGAAPPRDPPVVFRADRPFVYLIRDTKTGAILFIGRLSDPSAH